MVRARDPESWEGGGTGIKGSTLAANGLQPDLRATLSEGLVVRLRRENKGDEATLRGEGEPLTTVGVSRRAPEKESEVARPSEAML